jgi:nucleoside-diphosphate-sugar epimerase
MPDLFLVTGAAGFVGSRVARLLLDRGDRVVGLDDLNDAYDTRLKTWRLYQLEGAPGFTFLPVDIRFIGAVRDALASIPGEPPRAVLHLAARTGIRPSVEKPRLYLQANVTGTQNVLDACREHGVQKVVFSSSSSVYGNGTGGATREEQATDAVLSPYAASKRAAELLCQSYHHLYGMDVTVLRYFTVYGPAGRPDMSPLRFVQWICEERPVTLYGDGTQRRDFTYVDDIARGTIAAIDQKGVQTLNLGAEKPAALNDVIGVIEKLSGKKAIINRFPAHKADVDSTWADVSRAREQMGWKAEVSLEEGFGKLVDWYRANREWARDIVTG